MKDVHYLRPASLAEVHACLQQHPDAQLLAGGQSLLAAMRLGLAHPSHLVDLQDVPELHDIRVTHDGVWIGAMATHARIAAHPDIQQHHPMLAQLAHGIADQQVRNVGTLGGSLVNNDPAACWPAGVLAYGATLFTHQREIPADQFFTDLFTTALQPGEVLLGVLWPACALAQYVKYEQPASRFAMVGVAVTRGTGQDNSPVRVAITGLGNGVIRWPEAEAALQARWSVQALNGVHLSAELAHTDVHASASYRAHLSAVLCRRAVVAHTGENAHLPRTTPSTRDARARPTVAATPGLSIHGSHHLVQAVPLVWDALLDPLILQQCIPGCESIQRLSDTQYTAVVKIGLGPVSARFDTQIRVMPVRTPWQGEPAICHLHLSGQAGSMGQGAAEVVVQLRSHENNTHPHTPGTHLQWQATPTVSGQLAQLGNRLMQASARSLSTQFFERLSRVLPGGEATPPKLGLLSTCLKLLRHWHTLIFRK